MNTSSRSPNGAAASNRRHHVRSATHDGIGIEKSAANEKPSAPCRATISAIDVAVTAMPVIS